MQGSRTRGDRCPGVLRPWPADDGLLVRLRLIGGLVRSYSLRALLEVAESYGDGRIHVTGRANLQVRGFPGADGRLTREAVAAFDTTGLVPTWTHELVRNIMVSPQTGVAGGRADLRPVAAELDSLLCADPTMSSLPGRFLFVLDDGRGDLLDRGGDLGLVALDNETAQLRIGDGWGPVVPLARAVREIAALATEFLSRRGSGPDAAWHVAEFGEPLGEAAPGDPRLPQPTDPLGYGDVPGGRHSRVPEDGLGRAAVEELTATVRQVIVTPWRGVLVPDQEIR